MTTKSSPKVRTNAVHRWLCQQRRIAVERGVHTFTLRKGGKCSVDMAREFFRKCPEIAFTIQAFGDGCQFILSRPKMA